MFKFHLKLWSLCLAWTAFLAAAFVGLYHLSPGTHQIRPHRVAEEMSSGAAGSEGGEHLAILRRDTQRYVRAHPDAPAAMRAGKALAPAEYLNEELARDGEKFRVRKVEGAMAEMYSVS